MSEIKTLCRQNKVRTLYVFGSVLTNEFTESCDIDLIIEIDSDDLLAYADKYFNLKFALEEIFKRPIDLLGKKR